MISREYCTGRLGVGGSNPLAPTNKIRHFVQICFRTFELSEAYRKHGRILATGLTFSDAAFFGETLSLALPKARFASSNRVGSHFNSI